MPDIKVYGTDWCGDTHRARRVLDRKGVAYDYIDIDEDEAGEKKVIEFNKGKRRVPLVEIGSDDGKMTRLSVPSAEEIEKALG
jgi:mycoredoxin